MTVATLTEQLTTILGDAQVHEHAPLGPFTTFGVGGPADWLVEARSVETLQAVLQLAAESGVPVELLGGGSNVLISDAGVRGLVIRPRLTGITQPSRERVRAEAGVTINGLVRWLIGRGLAGLESWAGTPGTVTRRSGVDHSGSAITSATKNVAMPSTSAAIAKGRVASHDPRDVGPSSRCEGLGRGRSSTLEI